MAAKSSNGDPVTKAADELYALPVEEFTAARKRAATAAREDGDSAAAKTIAELRKPNAVAAAANALVRAHRNDIDQLLELGQALREATADLDAGQLRELSGQQHQVIAALVATARADSPGAFSEVTARGLADTLHAAMADPEAGDELTTGHLTGGLAASGFPGLDLGGAAGGGTGKHASGKSAGRARSGCSGDADALAVAKQAESDAQAAAKAADAEASEAADKLEEAEQTVAEAAQTVSRLESELQDARTARTDADRAERAARKARDKADRAATAARRDADATKDRHRQLRR
jgi:hypothetical protein